MDELLREFLTETAENLAVLDAELVQFEHAPDDSAILGNIFRLVHTIKGTCGFLGLARLESIAHAGENVLGKFRAGELAVSPQAVTSILKCIDAIRELLAALEQAGAEPAGDDSALLAELAAVAAGTGQASVTAAAPATVVVAEAGPCFPVAAEMLKEIEEALASGASVIAEQPCGAAPAGLEQNAPAGSTAPAPIDPKALQPRSPVPAPGGEAAPVETKALPVAQQSIRVPVETLESLMNLVSELVLTRNQLSQMVRGRADTDFTAPLQRLSHITSELQEGVMKTRMQPVGNAWSKLPRIIRDLAHETGKKLDLQMEGEQTELDRQVLEMIKDPLTHMVRNAADHGIEPPEERRRLGKPEAGVVRLTARHEGGHIIIEVSDDGRGLDIERIKRKALAQGLVREAELAQMSDQQIFQFVFNAGFSTAEKVTNVSGRGVGMDVVRTNIQKIGGSIELSSVAGQGSTFVIKIPLTLAIVSALIVSVGGLRFALPQLCVLELVGVDGGSDAKLETIRQTPLLRLRDRLLPLVDLRGLLKVGDALAGDPAGEKRPTFVVVTQVGQLRFGIIVDEVFDTEEIVVKPVNPMLRNIRYYAGNTILGDGGVVMILDPNGIAEAVGQRSTQREKDAAVSENAGDATSRLLTFRAGGQTQKAIPVELVARLEEIDLSNVETSQGRPMIQYRGHLMPLVACDPNFDWQAEGKRPVLVFTDAGLSMGLIVDEIVDIAEQELIVELSGRKRGYVGSAVIDGKATELLDTAHFLTQAFPDWFEAPGDGARARQVRLLLVEDSPFFQRLVTPVLEAEGYEVTVVGDAGRALELYRDGAIFDAVISDIELPGMSGLELARHLRKDQRSAGIPLLALSSHATDRDLEAGHSVGFTDYIAKFDRDGLMQSLARSLSEAHA